MNEELDDALRALGLLAGDLARACCATCERPVMRHENPGWLSCPLRPKPVRRSQCCPDWAPLGGWRA